MAYLNFIRGGQQYLHDVSAAIAKVPNNRGCMSGPDLLPNSTALYSSKDSVYEVLTRHQGCRSNSAQNNARTASRTAASTASSSLRSAALSVTSTRSPRTPAVFA